jgi:glycosyltransferase involved in cell wall biosynthesis
MENTDTKISIIIPVYKVERYLERTLNSAISQTYQNLEIILIDDGSPDKSGEICDRFARIDQRICVYKQSNKGVCAARNVGLKLMTGKYFFFLDSDDYIEDYTIERLYRYAKKYDADLVIGNLCTIDEKQIVKKNPLFMKECVDDTDMLEPSFRFAYFQSPGFGCSVCNKLYRTNFYRNMGLCFDERLRIAGDYLFNFYVFFSSPKIVLANEYSYFYCRYASTITKSKTDDFLKVISIIQEQQYTFFDDTATLSENADVVQLSILGSILRICFQTYKYAENPWKKARRCVKIFIESPIPKRFIKGMACGNNIRGIPNRVWRWYARTVSVALFFRLYSLVVGIYFFGFRFKHKVKRS